MGGWNYQLGGRLMSKICCKECASENVSIVKTAYTPSRSYEIVSKSGGGVYTERGSISLRIHKYVCFECGAAFERIPRQDLDKYNELKEHLT